MNRLPSRVSSPSATRRDAATHERSSLRAFVLPVTCALLLGGFGLLLPHPGFRRACTLAAVALLVGTAALQIVAVRRGRALTITFAPRAQHWIQAGAQTGVLLYWGWHVHFVYAFLPLIVSQLVFAYAIESLLAWSRRDVHALGFGPFPVVLSINLFLWFKPEW